MLKIVIGKALVPITSRANGQSKRDPKQYLNYCGHLRRKFLQVVLLSSG